ncbi:MAG: ATP-binding protein [Myxococcota bacterium]|nr:ATP-binding protein [Myxococcota bacterium]
MREFSSRALRVLMLSGDVSLAAALTAAGYDPLRPFELESVPDVDTALRLLAQRPFDALLVDLGSTPEPLACCQELAMQAASVPLLLRGEAQDPRLADYASFGACDYLRAGAADAALASVLHLSSERFARQQKSAKLADEQSARAAILDKIFDVLPVGLWLADKSGRLIRSNAKGREIWGAEPLVGPEEYQVFSARRMPSGDPIAPDDWALVHSIRSGVTVLDELLEIDALDGTRKLILNYTAPYFNEAGEVEGAVIVNLDITKMKETEEQLRVSLTKYGVLFESFPIALTIADAKGKLIESNREAVRLLGLDEEEQSRRAIDGGEWRIIRPDGSPMPPEEFASVRALQEKRPVHDVQMGIENGNSVTWISVSAAPIPLKDHGVAIAFLDITPRVLAEREVARNERQLEQLFDNMNEGFAVHRICTDEFGKPVDYEFLRFNQRFLRLSGLSADAIGKRVSEFFPSVSTEDFDWIGSYGKVALTGEPVQFEAPFGPLGRIFSISSFCPEPGLFACLIQDVTEQRALQASVAQADRLSSLGMLAAGVGHEINNPLSFLLGQLESLDEELPQLFSAIASLEASGVRFDCPLLKEEHEGDWLSALRARFREALMGARRIRDVSKGLASFARVEKDELELVNVEQALESALSMAANEIRYRARVHRDYSELPRVLAHEGRLTQVFLNLFLNACHAMDEGHKERNLISVRTWSDGRAAWVQISDTGEGIAPEHMDKLFDPFFSTKRPGQGSGLGLPISKNIIEGYGGRIIAQSELRKGAQFTLRLPVSAAALEELSSAEEVEPVQSASGLRVLIIDDEAGVRSLLSRMLKGNQLSQAASGAEAMALLEHERDFDAVFCDLMMSEVSGMELFAWVHERWPQLAERFVFVSGGAFTPLSRQHLASVDNPRLEKPFTSRQVYAILRSIAGG